MNRLEPTVSVCICTYNRCDSLERTLASAQKQGSQAWAKAELIVIDNNSSDNTSAVAESFADKLPLRVVRESKQGLSHARNRALAEAAGDWILFTDDDVILDEGWLSAFKGAFASHPDAAFAGGRIVPHWEGKPPHWFKGEHLDLIDGLLVWYDHGNETRLMSKDDPLPFGASFAVNRRLVAELGQFRTDLGVSGRDPGRGEETEFAERARMKGWKGIYVGEALCRHVADPNRFRPLALYRHGLAKARAHHLTGDSDNGGSRLAAALFLLRGLAQLVRGRGDRFRQCIVHAGIQRGLVMEK